MAGTNVAAPGAARAPDAGPRSRVRVLHLINLHDDGGAERFAVGLAMHLPKDRFEVWMCAPRGAEAGAQAALEQAGIPLLHLGRSAKWDVHRLGRLLPVIRRERIDVLHAHMFGSNLWGTLMGRASRVPVVLAHEQTWSYQGNPVRAWLDGHVIGRLATRFIAVSTLDAERMVSIEGVPPEKVVFIPNAYVPHADSQDFDLRARLGVPPGTKLIGTAVVMRPQKALEVLVEAFGQVLAQLPDVHLVLAGDGPCRAAVEEQLRSLGIDRQAHLLGRRNDVDAILRQLDVAVMSSDFEGTPLFAFECMANSAPLVATSVGGLPDIVRNGETGLLVPPRDPRALADAICRVLRDADLASNLARASHDRLDQYRIETIAGRFGELYESLLAQAGAGNHRPPPARA